MDMKLKYELKRLNKSKGKDFNMLCSLLVNGNGQPMQRQTLNKKLNGDIAWSDKQIFIVAEYYEIDACEVLNWIKEK